MISLIFFFLLLSMPQSPFNSCRLEAACQRALQGAACNQTAPTHLPASPIALCTCTLWSRRCFPPEDVAEGPGCPSAKCQMVHSHRTRDVARSHVAALAWGCSALGTWLLAWDSSGTKGKGTSCTQLQEPFPCTLTPQGRLALLVAVRPSKGDQPSSSPNS